LGAIAIGGGREQGTQFVKKETMQKAKTGKTRGGELKKKRLKRASHVVIQILKQM